MRKSKPVSAALLALALTLSFSTAALAEDTERGTCGENLTWTYADGVLTISGEGEMDYAPELPDSATSVVIEDGVSSIGAFAFSGCSGLTEVFIPESITSIGGGAFYECSALERIFLPERVVSIGAVAFYRCSSLKHISLPDSVT
ncbi:MAG: leucine-rich repeat domain-containing protein, partial [Oscillospiraceae bacterium]|nr:leucine-rich repeat domain-containing protein [Oscillospiraceae bacterium]